MNEAVENYTRSAKLDDTFVFSHIQRSTSRVTWVTAWPLEGVPAEDGAVQLLVSVSFFWVLFRC
jgi:hypothetical protein